MAVLGAHAAVYAGLETTSGTTLGHYAARLEAGVAIFFVISGCLLYRPFVRARLRGAAQPGAGPYAWRRFLRIVPAYWLALTVVTLAFGTGGDVFGWPGIPRFFGIAQAYSTGTIGLGLPQAWSLTIEVAFYAFLPIWAALTRTLLGRRGGFRGEAAALGLLFVAGLLYKLVVLASGDPHKVLISPALIALPAYFDQFALGMGLAVVSVWLEQRQGEPLPATLRWLERWPSISWLVALVAFWAVSTQIGLRGAFFEPFTPKVYFERHLLYTLIAVGIVAPAVVGDQTRGAVRRVLAFRPLLWLGLVSYGIFLWNLTMLDRLGRWGLGDVPVLRTFPGWCLLGLALSSAAAAVSYYALERPILSFKYVFGAQPRNVRGEALEEPAPATALARPAD